MDDAKEWILEWSVWPAPVDPVRRVDFSSSRSVRDKHRVLLCPDKDADGLSSALVLSRTLRALAHPASLTAVYHLPRGLNIHSPEAERGMLAAFPDQGGPTRCIVLDQGSRPGPPLVPPSQCKTLIIDHHLSDSFPSEAQVLSACHSLPVATSSVLTYSLCAELVPTLRGRGALALGALVGVYGDLGSAKIKFGTDADAEGPWPASLAAVEKRLTKSALAKSVALLNAPRRTPEFNVADAYAALEAAADAEDSEPGTGLRRVLGDARLVEAKERTSAETARWQAAPPVFTKDGTIAVVTVDSAYQSEFSHPPARVSRLTKLLWSPLSRAQSIRSSQHAGRVPCEKPRRSSASWFVPASLSSPPLFSPRTDATSPRAPLHSAPTRATRPATSTSPAAPHGAHSPPPPRLQT